MSSSKIYVKVEPMDPDEVAADEAEFSETLSEVTLKTVSKGEVSLDEIQVLSESVYFSKSADALKATDMRESLRRIRKHYVGLAQEFYYLAIATLTPEQLKNVVTDFPLPLPAMSTPLTCVII